MSERAHQCFEVSARAKIWMAADKKPIRKKTAQRSPSRPPASGKKVAKAGASGAGGKSSVRAAAAKPHATSKAQPAKKAASGKPETARSSVAPRKAAPKQGPQAGSAARKAPSKAPPPRAKDSARDKEAARKLAERDKAQAKLARDKEAAKKLAERDKERQKAERDKAKDKASREKEAARLAKEKDKEKQRLLKEKQAERVRLEREKEAAKKLALKERDKEKADLLRQKAAEANEKKLEKERQKSERENERLRQVEEKQREKDRLAAEKAALREKQLAEKQDEREALRLEREAEQQRAKAERDAEQQRAKAEREAERHRLKAEREEERLRVKAEREAERERVREEARQKREEERARREAEREAYRKAKEAERERLRAEREAARRALEGKVARASKRLQRGDGLLGRGITTTRVYRPEAIPDQSGTTRRVPEGAVVRPLGVRPPPLPQPQPVAVPAAVAETGAGAAPAPSPPESTPLPESTPEGKAEQMVSAPEQPAELERAAALTTPRIEPARATPPPPPSSLGIEERYQRILERLSHADAAFQREYRENFDMSWIYHDSALEGVVYTFQELKTAIDPNIPIVPDSSLQPACEEIRRHRQAIELVRELAERKRVPITVDTIKRLYVTLHPEEGDIKTVKYRKDIPQHRLYFHEYAAPDKIAYRVRQIVDWLNGPEPKKMKNPLRVAARVHYDLVRVFPFTTDSGKVARLLMNVILLRAGYPPAIIHSTERQRYYEALKGQLPVIIQMVADAISNALLSIEKLLDEHEARMRAGALG